MQEARANLMTSRDTARNQPLAISGMELPESDPLRNHRCRLMLRPVSPSFFSFSVVFVVPRENENDVYVLVG